MLAPMCCAPRLSVLFPFSQLLFLIGTIYRQTVLTHWKEEYPSLITGIEELGPYLVTAPLQLPSLYGMVLISDARTYIYIYI